MIRYFHLHYAVVYLANVNVKAPLAHFYGSCKVTIAEKAFPVIFRFDISRTCTNYFNSTAVYDVIT